MANRRDIPIIPLVRMPQQIVARGPEDDWTGITNPLERRKLQNRLNQRAHRESSSVPQLNINRCIFTTNSRITSFLELGRRKPNKSKTHSVPHGLPMTAQYSQSHNQYNTIGEYDILQVLQFSYGIAPPGTREYMIEFERQAIESYLQGSPNIDHLITLSRLNIQRAISDNLVAVGMTVEWTKDKSALSIFNLASPASPSTTKKTIPSGLQPTFIQRTSLHHPWFDVLPFPRIRDNLIRANGRFNDQELCRDLMASWDTHNTGATMLVWGLSWDPKNWEVTESFVRKWGWILRGCPEILMSTNQWRTKRGEKRLF